MNFINLKYYDELSSDAQKEAQYNVTASLNINHTKEIKEAAAGFLDNMHGAINDPRHIPRITNGDVARHKVSTKGDDYLIRFIRDNRAIFTESGDYVVYVSFFTMFINGSEYIPTPVQQEGLRKPYIDTNIRGPSYHAGLYRDTQKRIMAQHRAGLQ